MSDIAKTLRERPIRYASETQDEMQIRRQREREKGAAEIERLREAIKRAIRQHEEGNKGLSHRTLCEAVYGPQA